MSRSFTLSGFGSSADGNTALTIANSVVVSNTTSNVIVSPLSVAIGNSSVFNSINATSYNGTANNSLYLGGTAAASYVTTSSIGGLTANNTAYLGGLIASGYQTTAGLSANVATLAANSATYANSSSTNTFTVGTTAYSVANGDLYIGSATGLATSAERFQLSGTGSRAAIALIKTDVTTSGGSIAGMDSWAYDGNTYVVSGTINFRAAESWTNTNHGTDIQFRTTTTGSGGALAEAMRISGNGNVGIGTASPSTKLTVSGTQTIRGVGTDGGIYTCLYMDEVTSPYTSVFAGYTLSLNTGGNSARTSRLYVDNSGNVGVGNTVPTDKLSVNGTTYHQGNVILGSASVVVGLQANGGYGTAGQVLTSNGTATYWSTVSSGSSYTFSTGLTNTSGTITVNSSYIATISANNASYLGGVAAASYANTSGAYTFTGIHSYNVGGNTIYMANTTSNWISWGTAGVAAPSVTTKSAGTKLVLYEGTSATSVDYAIGIEGSHLWFSTTAATTGFKWYANTTNIMTANTTGLYMTGTLAINSSGGALVANNSSYLGGTAAASYLTTSSASSTYLPLAGGTMTGTITSSNSSIAIGTNGGVNRGYLYNDASGFGLLTSGGAWAVMVGYGTNTVSFAGIGQSAASFRAPVFYDSDNTGYYVDPASGAVLASATIGTVTSTGGYYYLLSATGGVNSTSSPLLYGDTTNMVLKPGSGNGVMYFQNYAGANKGYIAYSTGGMYFPILYDYDSTGYYVDPAGTSNMNVVNMLGGHWRSYQNTGYGGPVGAYVGYSTALEGACTSFHRGGAYALNMGLDSDNVFRIGGWSAAANRLQLDMSGNFYVAGNVTAYSSDERLKENIVTISDPIGMLKRLRGVFYDWKEWVNEDFGFNPIDRHDIGVIAQETQKVIPQAVKTAGFDTGLHGKSETGERYLTVQMEKIIPVLIESMKELVNRVEYLEAELAKK